LERLEHATEVLAHELDDEGLASEVEGDASLGADLVDESSAGLEGELLGENEGVVAIEQKGGDLVHVLDTASIWHWEHWIVTSLPQAC
jgi:hypothetical protein